MKSSRWFLFTAGAATVVLLFYATWHAGKVSAQLEGERLAFELNQIKQKVAVTEVELQQQKQQTDNLTRALSKTGRGDSLALVTKLRQQLLQSQAEANQYKEVILLEQNALLGNTKLLDALSLPGARLVQMKGADAAAESTAYALIVESSRMVFVASNLPKLAEGKQYQLWVLRRQEPKLVSAGVFTPDEGRRAVMDFGEPSVLSDVAEVEVTEEPAGGSETPTGDKLMTGTAAKADKTDEL
ncbi:MAG TPA: anti-sigma factor [Bryobacteraceae bacterium]|nr:anti-sigma factor [Bryobacteraceae bacterium]